MKMNTIRPLIVLLVIAGLINVWKQSNIWGQGLIVGIPIIFILLYKALKKLVLFWNSCLRQILQDKLCQIPAYIQYRKNNKKSIYLPLPVNFEDCQRKEQQIEEWLKEKSQTKGWFCWKWINYEKNLISLISPEGIRSEGQVYFKNDRDQPRVSRYIGYTGDKTKVILTGKRLRQTSDEAIFSDLREAMQTPLAMEICNKYMKEALYKKEVFIDVVVFQDFLAPIDSAENRKLKLLAKVLVDCVGFAAASIEKGKLIQIRVSMHDGEPV